MTTFSCSYFNYNSKGGVLFLVLYFAGSSKIKTQRRRRGHYRSSTTPIRSTCGVCAGDTNPHQHHNTICKRSGRLATRRKAQTVLRPPAMPGPSTVHKQEIPPLFPSRRNILVYSIRIPKSSRKVSRKYTNYLLFNALLQAKEHRIY